MRKAIFLGVVAILLVGAVFEVVAAGVKTVTIRNHFYSTPATGIGLAVPASMKSFPTELLPQ